MTYVQVMVPEDQLLAVYQLLGASGTAGSVRPAAASALTGAPGTGTWTDEAFIREHLVPRSATIRKLALYLADRPGEAVTSEDAATALGLEYGWNSLAGALGAAGNYFANHGIDFPWSSVYETPDGRARLTMDPAVAEAVKAVLS